MAFVSLMCAVALAAVAAPPANPSATGLTTAIGAYRAGHFAEARQGFTVLADRDSAVAETMLGTMYARGQGVRADPATAATYYFRAAQRGYPPAQLAFAQALAAGHGIAADRDTAWVWARRAQQRGDQRVVTAATSVIATLAAGRSAGEMSALEGRLDGWRPWANGRE